MATQTMQVEERTLFSRVDTNLIVIILALNFIGLLNVYSATHGASVETSARLFYNQLIWMAVGWTAFFVTTFIDYRLFIRIGFPFYLVNVICLILTDLFGTTVLGAQRWLNLGLFRYQPSETMKTVLILMMSGYLARRAERGGFGFRQLVLPTIWVVLPFSLIVAQPDLGTAMMVFLIGMTMIAFVGVKTRVIVAAVIIGAITLPLAWSFGLKEYQRNRVLTFIDPTRDPRGAGYNSIQSLIAVGSGQFFGKGFRKGSQAQLEFLPEQHTDFIFSVLSEEHGFVGSTLTVVLYSLLIVFGIRIASQARDKTGAILTMGVVGMIFWHMFINIGMVTGLLPIVGIPLPLVSYGGSSMLTTMIGLGLISSVAYRRYLF